MELDGWARGFQPEPTGDSSKDSSPLNPSLPTPKEFRGDSNDSDDDSSDTDAANRDLRNRLRMLSITPNSRRYFGKSSGISFLRSALSAKSKVSNGDSPGIDSERRLQRRDDFWHLRPVRFDSIILSRFFLIDCLSGNLNASSPPSETTAFLSQIFLRPSSQFTLRTLRRCYRFFIDQHS